MKIVLRGEASALPRRSTAASGFHRGGRTPGGANSHPYIGRISSSSPGLASRIVTSGEDGSARNFGMDKLYEHDLRYDMADEYLDLVNQLWDSWEPDAVVRDRETGTYADPGKVHAIDFAGKFYKSRGPLNTVPSPQVRPTFVQAGGSPRGREFASRNADSIIATATGIEGMRAYRDDVRARAEKNGRNPDDIKVLFLVSPTLAPRLKEAGVDRTVRGKEGASDHAPAWIVVD